MLAVALPQLLPLPLVLHGAWRLAALLAGEGAGWGGPQGEGWLMAGVQGLKLMG